MIPAKAPIAKDVNFKRLAEFPLSGGNIKNAVLNSARKAAYEKLTEINMDCFVHSCQKEIESTQAFVSAYEQGVHSRQLAPGAGMQRDFGKISISKKQKREMTDGFIKTMKKAK